MDIHPDTCSADSRSIDARNLQYCHSHVLLRQMQHQVLSAPNCEPWHAFNGEYCLVGTHASAHPCSPRQKQAEKEHLD